MQSRIELQADQTIVFIGDSITDADRNHPAYRPFGFGYVHFVANMLLAKYPNLNISVINTGINANTVRDLAGRWEKDCIKCKPDVLSVLIGINDVWRQYGEPERQSAAVYPVEYESTYRRLLWQAKQRCNCRLVLMEPFMFCGNRQDEIFQTLLKYVRVVRELAREFDAVLVPLQSRIDEQIKHVPAEKWSLDSVHPHVWAHAWIAQRWFEATGL